MDQEKINEVLARIASGDLEVPDKPKTGSKIELPAWRFGMDILARKDDLA